MCMDFLNILNDKWSYDGLHNFLFFVLILVLIVVILRLCECIIMLHVFGFDVLITSITDVGESVCSVYFNEFVE